MRIVVEDFKDFIRLLEKFKIDVVIVDDYNRKLVGVNERMSIEIYFEKDGEKLEELKSRGFIIIRGGVIA